MSGSRRVHIINQQQMFYLDICEINRSVYPNLWYLFLTFTLTFANSNFRFGLIEVSTVCQLSKHAFRSKSITYFLLSTKILFLDLMSSIPTKVL